MGERDARWDGCVKGGGGISRALAIIAIVVRFQFSGYKRNARKGYLAYLVASVIAAIAYIIATGTIVGESVFDTSMASSLVANIVLVIVNFIYFNKRDHLFVNWAIS